MEVTFQKSQLAYVKKLLDIQRDVEQTLEVKLPEGMPDVGTVLGAWGQVLIRAKEWNGDNVGVSGGVMAWVLYLPEDATTPLCVQGWLPFQSRWEIPPAERDGSICVLQALRHVDARCVSSRKLIVRAVVSLQVKAYADSGCSLYTPEQVPEDVQLQMLSYPMTLAAETGEKSFSVDELLDLPPNSQIPEKCICLRVQPEIIDHKVIAGRLVMRGALLIRGLCRGQEDSLWPLELEVPFSQYTDLVREYPENAQASVHAVLTGLELDPENGQLHLKAGLIAQYTLYDHSQVELVADAYSTCRQAQPVLEALELPGILEQSQMRLQAQGSLPEDCQELTDAVFFREPVQQEQTADGVTARVSGRFQMLYRKADGTAGCGWSRWEETVELPAHENSQLSFVLIPSGKCQLSSTAVKADLRLYWEAVSRTGLQMVTGVELGQETVRDAQRPSLILRRFTDQSLWELAKSTGSTVADIEAANGLTEQPARDTFLLIPVS